MGHEEHFDLSRRVYVYILAFQMGHEAHFELSRRVYVYILAFLDGTRVYSCIPGCDTRDTLTSADAYMCIFLHSWMGHEGHFDLSRLVYVYIHAFLDGTRGTL